MSGAELKNMELQAHPPPIRLHMLMLTVKTEK
jgi:hypothetical protein